MTKRMLIDATHAEETRVVVLDGNRLEDFDVETSTKRQLKGNIYLAKVVRVEPSLQAAFIEYGGNRHGFLAFGEIHPDYYQIPVADRERLIAAQEAEAREEEEAEDRAALEAERGGRFSEAREIEEIDVEAEAEAETDADAFAPDDEEPGESDFVESGSAGEAETANEVESFEAEKPSEVAPETMPPVSEFAAVAAPPPAELAEAAEPAPAPSEEPGRTPEDDDRPSRGAQPAAMEHESVSATVEQIEAGDTGPRDALTPADPHAVPQTDPSAEPETEVVSEIAGEAVLDGADHAEDAEIHADPATDMPPPETVGGDGPEDRADRRIPPRFLRNYKIQEVIKRRQIMLVQVVKEERGTKGAALTTYISLAGRFCVLMPNSPRGGGISRKITSAADRRRLQEITSDLDVPRGMGLVVRTAGANRPKPEIKRDCDYLMRTWDEIRELTMRSVAPALIYEEASLIKRAIRDVYSREFEEVLVDGEEGWKAARDFMRMLMPAHAKKVQLWRDPTGGGMPLFARYAVDAQLDAMMSPTVQLRSGGYLVINQTEALVAIDVNSGRSTRERGIEETALRTNLEAADEAARQLRLRDLAGLIVIDFIDMEAKKHNAMVERRLKEALKNDRARIQVGHISHFGLLEMSRQRLRPSLAETSFVTCPHCGGLGHVRSTESSAIHVLRAIEEEGAKRRAAEIVVHCAGAVAMYVLNHKRDRLADIEARYAMRVSLAADDTLLAPETRIERLRAQVPGAAPVPARALPPPPVADEADADLTEDDDVTGDDADADMDERASATEVDPDASVPGETAEEGERRRKRRRRRRRGGRREEGGAEPGETPAATPFGDAAGADAEIDPELDGPGATHIEGVPEHMPDPADEGAEAEAARSRRRGRRGGRRRRREDGEFPPVGELGAEQPDLTPAYVGPTPADPFGGQAFDIFDVIDRAEAATQSPPQAPARSPEPVMAEPVMAEPVEQAADLNAAPIGAPSDVHAAAPDPASPILAEEPPDFAPAVDTIAVAPPEPEPPVAEPQPAEAPAEAVTPPPVAEETRPEPAIRPVIVGATDAPVEKKRGWWRR
jgi:ribonuclease E